MKSIFCKVLAALLLSGFLSFSGAATPVNSRSAPPERERQVTLLRKQVLEKLIQDAERLEQIEAANLVEDTSRRQELADGRYVLFFNLHDLTYRVEMNPQGKMISFGRSYEWWEIALYGIGLIALGFAAGASVAK